MSRSPLLSGGCLDPVNQLVKAHAVVERRRSVAAGPDVDRKAFVYSSHVPGGRGEFVVVLVEQQGCEFES